MFACLVLAHEACDTNSFLLPQSRQTLEGWFSTDMVFSIVCRVGLTLLCTRGLLALIGTLRESVGLGANCILLLSSLFSHFCPSQLVLCTFLLCSFERPNLSRLATACGNSSLASGGRVDSKYSADGIALCKDLLHTVPKLAGMT